MSRNDLNSTSGTNWAALESRSQENIDYSDIPPLTDEFFERSTLRMPADRSHNLVQLDPDVISNPLFIGIIHLSVLFLCVLCVLCGLIIPMQPELI